MISNAQTPESPMKISRFAIVHFILIIAFFAAWSIALLSPIPKETAKEILVTDDGLFFFAKFLHFAAYAFLMVLGGTQRALRNYWVWLIVVLVIHGEVTEYIQQFVGRNMSVRDSLIDTAGVLTGALIVAIWRKLRLKNV